MQQLISYSPQPTLPPSITAKLIYLDVIRRDLDPTLHKAIQQLEIGKTQVHANYPVSIGRASIIMEDLENLLDVAHSQKFEHSTIAFIELSTALDDPFNSVHPLDPRPLDTYDATKPCYLLTIPRELRDMISDYTISIGGVQILRTSRQLREEGTQFLYKRRVCHLDIDLTKYVPKFSLQKPIAALIQNVNIDISLDFNVDPLLWLHNMKPVGKFAGAMVPRQMCRVMVLFRHYPNCDFDSILLRVFHTLEWIMTHIGTLVGFSHLTFEYKLQVPTTASERLACSALTSFHYWAFLEQYLGLDLGPSPRHGIKDSRRQYFEFHPRGCWEANPGSLSEGTQGRTDRWSPNMKKQYIWMLGHIIRAETSLVPVNPHSYRKHP